MEIEEPLRAAPPVIPSLRSNFAWTLAGNVLYAGCQWGMLSALAKLGTPSIVGQFTLGLAICAPVFMFTNLQLRALQATDVSAECGFANYFTLRLLATLTGLAVIAALLPFAGASLAVRIVVLLVAVSKCIECMSDVTAGLLQREEQLKRVAISLMIRGCGSVAVFSLTFAHFRNLALSVLAMSGIWLGVLLFYDVPNARALIGRHDVFFRFDRSALWRLAMLGLPLGWVATFASLYVNIPRYFIQHYLGLADQGIYASLAYLVVVINLIVVALSVSVTTRLAHLFAERNMTMFVHLLTRLSMLGVLIAAAGVPLALLVGRPLLCLLYRREYGDHVGLLALFVGITGVSTIGTFVFCGLTAARTFRAQAPVQFAAMVTGLAASALLVPRYGLIGGGTALLLSAMTVVLGGVWIMHRVLRAEALQK
ncbi:MAG TPA: lipopolysaccharide biosynthesis protein [Terracidiphilus sp.]|nr:lipopolysaccharide biosynthesis protein [Terracidiphilus sp.]